ncbi:MAG TPA: acyl-CoA dehydrogenase family protein [Actinomycetospora sp.]|nr:acyl-CoA dehydrogenase family protein [Actinomycetospora sp.]
MFFALTDDQQAFAATVREFLADRFDLDAVRGVVEDPDGDGHPLTLWKGLAEQGALAVLVPEEHDGLGLGLLDAQVVARELGAGVAPGPWTTTVLAAEAVRLAGSPEQQARWLPALAAGEIVGTVALRGEAGSWDGRGITVDASGQGGSGSRLSGTASPVDYPAVAGLVVVAATDHAGAPGLFLVEPGAQGLAVRDQHTYDGTARVGAVELADTPAEALSACSSDSGGTLSGADAVSAVLARGAVLTAADLVGVAREALTRTVDYDRDRKQFGVPVGSFQAIKHTMADLHVGVTMAEHAVLFAAHAVDTEDPGADIAVAVAKAKAADAAWAATGAMIQFFGGIGFTWEHEAHFFYKRARRRAPLFGTADEHRERLAVLTMDR